MQVLVESKHTLMVETRGRVVFLAVLTLVLLHFLWLLGAMSRMLDYSAETGAGLTALLSLCCYLAALYLARKPFADRRTLTFHGQKHAVFVERSFLGFQYRSEIPFEEIQAFELAAPLEGGYFRVRDCEGHSRKLLRVRTLEEFEVLRRLDLITKRPLEVK